MHRPPNRRIVMTIIAFIALAVGAAALRMYWPHAPTNLISADSDAGPAAESGEVEADVVVLPAEKITAAAIESVAVSRGPMTHLHSVPGRLQYNENRHVDVRSPASGILTEILVKPGDKVEAGQIIACLNSPEVGTARADALKQRAVNALAQKSLERAHVLHDNLTEAGAALEHHEPFDALKARFADKSLGPYRERLFSAYSRLLLAEAMAANAKELGSSGALPGKTLLERQSEQRSAEAELAGLVEQALWEAWNVRNEEEAAADDAARRLQVTRQKLSSLLMSRAAIDPAAEVATEEEMGTSDDDLTHLSRVSIVAPIGGTIEQRLLNGSERVRPSDTLFVLADATSLWIRAEIRENDWPAVTLQEGREVLVTTPALPGRRLTARVHFIGREVSPETNAVPLIAELSNAEGLLRPGLFVRVEIPISTRTDVVSVPEQAVLQHDAKSFVFVCEAENRFRRVNVQIGETSNQRTEILGGLSEGQSVVSRGAFILKSEMLLESMEE